jgi:hypothetical protein
MNKTLKGQRRCHNGYRSYLDLKSSGSKSEPNLPLYFKRQGNWHHDTPTLLEPGDDAIE